ncbi:hypothetical protein ACEPAH_9362 [Sanghuangporus vaninii]
MSCADLEALPTLRWLTIFLGFYMILLNGNIFREGSLRRGSPEPGRKPRTGTDPFFGSSATMFSVGLSSVAALAFVTLRAAVVDAAFQLVQNHQGADFLNDWIFYSGIDANNTGNVLFQTKEQAEQQQLTFLNSAGNFIIKVDNTTNGQGNSTFGRPSVKILSSYTISSGNLVLFDAVHMPYGCSVWPAYWTQGPAWPDDGEIDIVEAVNMDTINSISLHTLNGCRHPEANVSSSIETGNLVQTDCFNQTNFNQGCIVDVPGPSYGQAFAENGGGVYALNWNDTGIYVWFFPRGSIPTDLPTDTPNPDGWGLPTAAYPATSCDFNTFFRPQTLIIHTTICGNFAGQPNVYAQTCSGTCLDLVQIPDNYDNAYFEISYLKVFQFTNGSTTSTAVTSATGTSTADSSPSSTDVVTVSGSTWSRSSPWPSLLFVLAADLLCIYLYIY